MILNNSDEGFKQIPAYQKVSFDNEME